MKLNDLREENLPEAVILRLQMILSKLPFWLRWVLGWVFRELADIIEELKQRKK